MLAQDEFVEEGFSWGEILANFGWYPPALDEIAAAVARPTLSNIRAVEWAYRQGGYSAPGPLMDWLWSRYYREWQSLPGTITGTLADYMPLILIGGLVLIVAMRK